MRLEDLVAPFHLQGLQQPTCACCDEGLTVECDAVMFGTTVKHRGWAMRFSDREVMRDPYDAPTIIHTWMANMHREAALELCGEITKTYEEEMS